MREKLIEGRIRAKLEADGWLTEKTHGNAYQSGFPDLFCHHPQHGTRWIEVKTPKGRLTKAQRKKFPVWDSFGVKIWVLTSEEEVHMLFGTPNWRTWWEPLPSAADVVTLLQNPPIGGRWSQRKKPEP